MAELDALAEANLSRWSVLDSLIASVSSWIYSVAPLKDRRRRKLSDFKVLE